MDRARRCFPGAITAPAGLDAATPPVFKTGAAAVPTGFGVLFCGGSELDCEEPDCEEPDCEAPDCEESDCEEPDCPL
jgi:hypothetical protein